MFDCFFLLGFFPSLYYLHAARAPNRFRPTGNRTIQKYRIVLYNMLLGDRAAGVPSGLTAVQHNNIIMYPEFILSRKDPKNNNNNILGDVIYHRSRSPKNDTGYNILPMVLLLLLLLSCLNAAKVK